MTKNKESWLSCIRLFFCIFWFMFNFPKINANCHFKRRLRPRLSTAVLRLSTAVLSTFKKVILTFSEEMPEYLCLYPVYLFITQQWSKAVTLETLLSCICCDTVTVTIETAVSSIIWLHCPSHINKWRVPFICVDIKNNTGRISNNISAENVELDSPIISSNTWTQSGAGIELTTLTAHHEPPTPSCDF